MEFIADTTEQIYVRPGRDAPPDTLRDVELDTVFVPPMTGVGLVSIADPNRAHRRSGMPERAIDVRLPSLRERFVPIVQNNCCFATHRPDKLHSSWPIVAEIQGKGEQMGIQTHFDKFHGRIKLGRQDEAYTKARERDDSIKKDVKSAFKDAGYPVVDDFIQGSLKTHTGIVPISGDYDIDRALVIEDDTAPDNPVTPKKKALDVLEDRGFKNAKIKKPCVTADYASDNVHIDFIIYKRLGDEHYLAVGKKNSDEDNREWSAADPLGLIEWINDDSLYDQDDAKDVLAQFRRLVRYLKRWRDVRFTDDVAAKVYSIGLTVMVKSELILSFSDEGARQDLQALRKTVRAILDGGYFDEDETGRYRVRVHLPVEPWRDIFDGSSLDTGTQLYNKLKRLEEKLVEVEGLSDEHKQCEVLSELFGDDFEVPDPPSGSSKSAKAKYPSAGRVTTSVGA